MTLGAEGQACTTKTLTEGQRYRQHPFRTRFLLMPAVPGRQE